MAAISVAVPRTGYWENDDIKHLKGCRLEWAESVCYLIGPGKFIYFYMLKNFLCF